MYERSTDHRESKKRPVIKRGWDELKMIPLLYMGASVDLRARREY